MWEVCFGAYLGQVSTLRPTTGRRMEAAHQKLDRRRDDLCAGALRKRARNAGGS
jgi:hypothetical protein